MNTTQVTTASDAASSILGGTDTTTTTPLPQQTLGQDDFLKLLVAQMSAQDPLNPVSNSDFIAQMAQFSTLQQTTTMQTDLASMASQQGIVQANNLIGRNVSVTNADGSMANGTVSAVQITNGTPQIVVNGVAYDLSAVSAIAPPTQQPSMQAF
jgi:flagellar basal-body rod modification protein FlgD